jgi:hypothetical protein
MRLVCEIAKIRNATAALLDIDSLQKQALRVGRLVGKSSQRPGGEHEMENTPSKESPEKDKDQRTVKSGPPVSVKRRNRPNQRRRAKGRAARAEQGFPCPSAA